MCAGLEQSLAPSERRRSRSQAKCRLHANKLHSKGCPGVSQEDRPCVQCRYLRKLLVNQACYKKRKMTVVSGACVTKNLVKCNLQLRHEKAKVGKLQTTIARMKQDNATMPEEKLEQSLIGLPEKQRQQVKACFQASKREGRQGMKYSQKWVLECILMRIKSLKLYEHIRRHELSAQVYERLQELFRSQ